MGTDRVPPEASAPPGLVTEVSEWLWELGIRAGDTHDAVRDVLTALWGVADEATVDHDGRYTITGFVPTTPTDRTTTLNATPSGSPKTDILITVIVKIGPRKRIFNASVETDTDPHDLAAGTLDGLRTAAGRWISEDRDQGHDG